MDWLSRSLVVTTREGTRERYRSQKAIRDRGRPCVWPTTVPYMGSERAKEMGTDVCCRPHSQPSEKGLAPHPGFPRRGQSLPTLCQPHVSQLREGAELGGQERHEEEGDAHSQGQVFPLGARPADAFLQLGHLGILSLKVLCGQMNREGGESWAARAGGARGGGGSSSGARMGPPTGRGWGWGGIRAPGRHAR